jgi:hypothetical protein
MELVSLTLYVSWLKHSIRDYYLVFLFITGGMVEKLALSTSVFHLNRLEEQRHTAPDFPFRVCQDFWFSDGNVVLSAGSFAFKVHRGQLERHAEIFQTMLSIPQPENADSTINLCDSPTDVYHLLRALYDGLYEK